MRSLTRATSITAVAAASLLLAPVTAAFASVPGDNGDVKVHRSTTPEDDQANQPHVCTFYLDAFNFDGHQSVTWKIDQWAPTGKKGKQADSGTITLDTHGHGRTPDQNLPDGHYKLFWKFTGEHGFAKQKVFWVECKSGPTATASASATATSTATSTATATATATTSGTGTATSGPSGSAGSTSPAGGAGAPSASSSSTGAPSLAETGANVGGITVGGLLLVGAGAVLVMRRRRPAGRH